MTVDVAVQASIFVSSVSVAFPFSKSVEALVLVSVSAVSVWVAAPSVPVRAAEPSWSLGGYGRLEVGRS